MIDREGIQQILNQYAKHGWTLRRVLLSSGLAAQLPEITAAFGPADVRTADLDRLWFSRSSRPGITAWELRHLANTPFALVANISDVSDAALAEEVLSQTETKMIEAIGKRNSGH